MYWLRAVIVLLSMLSTCASSAIAQEARFTEILDEYAVLRARVCERGSVCTREIFKVSTPDEEEENVTYARYVWSDGMETARHDTKLRASSGLETIAHRLKRGKQRFRLDKYNGVPLIQPTDDPNKDFGVPFMRDFFAFPILGLWSWQDGQFLASSDLDKMIVISVLEDGLTRYRALVLYQGAKAVFDFTFSRIGDHMVPTKFRSLASPSGANGPPLAAQSLNVKEVLKWHPFVIRECEWKVAEDLVLPTRFTFWSDRECKTCDEELEVIFSNWKIGDAVDATVLTKEHFESEATKKMDFAPIEAILEGK